MTAIAFDRSSVEHLMHNLAELPRRVQGKHERIGLNAWGGVVKNVAVAKVREDTKLLKRSLIVKVTVPKMSWNAAHHHLPSRAQVGPSRKAIGFVASVRGNVKKVTARKAAKLTQQGVKVRTRKPSRYAHLVEKLDPFIGPAQQAGATAGMAKLALKIRDGIAQEATALGGNR